MFESIWSNTEINNEPLEYKIQVVLR